MTGDDESDDSPTWPPAAFTQSLTEASEETVNSQMELFKQFMSAGVGGFDDMAELGSIGMGSAVFKTRVQSGGRISIPDAEREALDIEEGDIVQTVVIPVKRNR